MSCNLRGLPEWTSPPRDATSSSKWTCSRAHDEETSGGGGSRRRDLALKMTAFTARRPRVEVRKCLVRQRRLTKTRSCEVLHGDATSGARLISHDEESSGGTEEVLSKTRVLHEDATSGPGWTCLTKTSLGCRVKALTSRTPQVEVLHDDATSGTGWTCS